MTININCGSCGKFYNLKPETAGQTFVCQSCGSQVAVPGRQPEAAQPVADSSPTPDGNFEPYPGTTTNSAPSGGQQAALDRVKLPATFMMVIAGLSLAS